MRQLVAWFSPETGVLDSFTWQGTVDKNSFTIQAGNAPRLMIQRFDNPDWHGQLRKSANSINRLDYAPWPEN